MPKTRRHILIVCAVFAVVLSAAMGVRALLIRTPEDQRDKRALWDELGDLARDMIAENAVGVVQSGDEKFISSFPAFFDYVAKRRPKAVSSVDAKNPFPGILPGTIYTHSDEVFSNGKGILIRTRSYSRPIGNVRYGLRSNGTVDAVVEPQ